MSSGSASSAWAVNPTRSQNRTLTTLRSSRCRPGAASGAAQARQNRARSGLSSPQCWQTAMRTMLDHLQLAHAELPVLLGQHQLGSNSKLARISAPLMAG